MSNSKLPMPTFKHFFLDAEPLPGTHFYPHAVSERDSEEVSEEIIEASESAPAPHYAPAPYAPPAPPPGMWEYQPMFIHGHAPAYGHPEPAPSYGHPAPTPEPGYFIVPAPYHPEPAPYHPEPAPYHPGPFHPSKMPEFRSYSFKILTTPAPEPEDPTLDLRQSKSIDEEPIIENSLPVETPAKEAPLEEAPLKESPFEEAPIEEAPLEEAPLEEEEGVTEEPIEEDISEQDNIDEFITEEPLEEEAVTQIVEIS